MIFMYEWRYGYQIMMHNPFLLCNTECIIVYLLDQFIWVRFGVPCGAFESFEFVRGMDAKPLPNLVPSSVPGEASATCLSQRPSWWSVHGWKLWETDGNLLDLWKLEWEDPRSLALTLTSDFNFIILSLFSKISLALKIVHVFFLQGELKGALCGGFPSGSSCAGPNPMCWVWNLLIAMTTVWCTWLRQLSGGNLWFEPFHVKLVLTFLSHCDPKGRGWTAQHLVVQGQHQWYSPRQES